MRKKSACSGTKSEYLLNLINDISDGPNSIMQAVRKVELSTKKFNIQTTLDERF
jgi:hypothetical protein